ncbi:unnamed protein product [Caenorhabditis angaria]|uniref:Uncharacterized protein n=1 Tax=Caenorhabditis angaria TaxID=860376 RepID=A0A9P1NAE2_9PELO|nr:unnamed protein product [Caenorhabditis angaria]
MGHLFADVPDEHVEYCYDIAMMKKAGFNYKRIGGDLHRRVLLNKKFVAKIEKVSDQYLTDHYAQKAEEERKNRETTEAARRLEMERKASEERAEAVRILELEKRALEEKAIEKYRKSRRNKRKSMPKKHQLPAKKQK